MTTICVRGYSVMQLDGLITPHELTSPTYGDPRSDRITGFRQLIMQPGMVVCGDDG